MVFKPIPCKTRWEGLIVCFWIILIDVLLLVWTIQRPTGPIRFGLILLIVASVPLLIHLLYRTWAIFSLEYWIDRNAVTVAGPICVRLFPCKVCSALSRAILGPSASRIGNTGLALICGRGARNRRAS